MQTQFSYLQTPALTNQTFEILPTSTRTYYDDPGASYQVKVAPDVSTHSLHLTSFR